MLSGAAGAGALRWLGPPPRARAGNTPAWGDYPADALQAAVPAERQAKTVLEVFVNGGMSPWETFYAVDQPEYGLDRGEQWFTFLDADPSLPGTIATCAGDTPLLLPFRTDALGAMVNFGPFADPLRQRQDIVDRMRLHVVTHDLEPHALALPLAATGFRGGDPNMAGIGAAVARYELEHPVAGAALEPTSYVFTTPVSPPDLEAPLWAAGRHPGAAQPVVIRVAAGVAFAEALHRAPIAARREASDALWALYQDEYGKRLTTPHGAAARAATFRAYGVAKAGILDADVLAGFLTPELFQRGVEPVCGLDVTGSHVGVALRLAARVLSRPAGRARHVTVVDSGTELYHGNTAYDGHQEYLARTAPNLRELWTQLSAVINEPGEGDPNKLNLDETLVSINTEFGRAPGTENGTGRAHWPRAYVTMMFGGPIGPDQQGIVGAIGPDAQPHNALRPVETRAALLAALGIYPFMPESYAPNEVAPDAATALEASLWLREVVLGLS